jgi:hypothetical protein
MAVVDCDSLYHCARDRGLEIYRLSNAAAATAEQYCRASPGAKPMI